MRHACRIALFLVALCLGAGSAGWAAEKARTQKQLQEIARQIEKVRAQVRKDALERDRLARDLAAAEGSVSRARGELERLRRERAEREKERARLAAEKRAQEARLAQVRESLAAQVRAAYQLGPREPLRLVLTRQDPARIGRDLAYYGYFARARAAQADEISQIIADIDAQDAKIAAEDAELERLEAERRSQLQELEDARRQRSQVLAALTAEARDRQQALQRLQRERAALEKLLKDLDRALKDFPVDPNDAFARLRGQLAWPVNGTLVARYGETRAGGVRWNGVLVATERGAPVRAIHHGRVVYADTLPGLGLLAIVDHGSGYLSLYGHNDQLLKAAGSEVRAGEVIASAGDTGGRPRPELYFEIRRAGKPVDPLPWFRTRTPPR